MAVITGAASLQVFTELTGQGQVSEEAMRSPLDAFVEGIALCLRQDQHSAGLLDRCAAHTPPPLTAAAIPGAALTVSTATCGLYKNLDF